VSRLSFFKRGAVVLAAALAAAGSGCAPVARAELARQDPGHCQGQKELKPLEPLSVRTARGQASFLVEVADTPTKQEFGLMCRRSLAADRGMLFMFKGAPTDRAFWMRNTLIPLDIIYIRPDGRVLSVAANAQPLNEMPIPAGGPTKAVLELAAGRAAQIGLLPGDRILTRGLPRG
jgi:uncharacterized membrane protein (UPF0127 family)